MKKGLLFVLIALLVVVTVVSTVAFAKEPTAGSPTVTPTATEENDEISSFVKELCELNAECSKSGDNTDKRNFLLEKFREALATSNFKTNVEEQPFGDNSYRNIVATLVKDGTQKQIIIGAHYDTKGEGADDNAVGVAALYYTMKALAVADDLPFNITFVAFDGEEEEMLGSNYFVNGANGKGGMSAEEVANTLVMFNIDSIALGTNMYLMCENRHTSLANTILTHSEGIVEKPYARGTYGSYLDDIYGTGYGYYEFVQRSDHTPFRLAGIPIAFFFSGEYSNGSWDFNAGDTINTEADTFDNLKDTQYEERILAVSGAIVNTLLDEQFVEVATNARSQLVNLNLWYNKWWASLIIFVILVVLAICTWLYSRKLQKNAILGTAEIKTQKVFEKPDASDIFSFGETNSENKTDVDDIFTFKK